MEHGYFHQRARDLGECIVYTDGHGLEGRLLGLSSQVPQEQGLTHCCRCLLFIEGCSKGQLKEGGRHNGVGGRSKQGCGLWETMAPGDCPGAATTSELPPP